MTYIEKEEITNKATIYTDGSCWFEAGGGIGGWGALIIQGEDKKSICGGSTSTTNNEMEITACIKALKSLERPSRVDLFTDSKYVINGITSWIRGWKRNNWTTQNGEPVKNKDLWEDLDHLCRTHIVNWNWVKGHSGNPGNDIADSLASKGKAKQKELRRKSISIKR